jgi:DHA1 family bicyclomycin/chloramphenicol resistance-like MFS transporter
MSVGRPDLDHAVTAKPTRAPLVLLVAATSLGPLTINIFIPSMPGLARDFATDYATVQLTLTLYLIGIGVGQLLWGPVSDRHGRRPVMIAGLGVYTVGSALCLIAPSIELLVAGRVVQSVGGCAGLVMARTILRDVYERDRAASMLAYVTVGMVLAPMLAPTIGGYLDGWFGWRTAFMLLLGLGIALVGWCVALLPETHHARSTVLGLGSMLASFAVLIRRRAFCGYAFQISMGFAIYMTFLAAAPYIMLEGHGYTPEAMGPWFIVVGGCYACGNFAAGRLSQREGVDRMIAAGLAIQVVGVAVGLALALGGIDHPLALFGPIGIMSIGQGLTIPNGTVGAVGIEPARAGAAAGLAGFLTMALGAPASYLGGAIADGGTLPVMIVILGATALAIVSHVVGVVGARSQTSRGS